MGGFGMKLRARRSFRRVLAQNPVPFSACLAQAREARSVDCAKGAIMQASDADYIFRTPSLAGQSRLPISCLPGIFLCSARTVRREFAQTTCDSHESLRNPGKAIAVP